MTIKNEFEYFNYPEYIWNPITYSRIFDLKDATEVLNELFEENKQLKEEIEHLKKHSNVLNSFKSFKRQI